MNFKYARLVGLAFFAAALLGLSLPASAAWETPRVKEAKAKLARNPGDARVMIETAEMMYRDGLCGEAVEIWQKLMESRPTMAKPPGRRGIRKGAQAQARVCRSA